MKSILFIFLLLNQSVTYSQPCAPTSPASGVVNPPNKLCYNYDKSGNRTGHGLSYKGQAGFGIIGQFWYGTPTWFKASSTSIGGRGLFLFDN